ncbi:MAG TPA: phage major capsid protein, partial [Thermohalobaculum sp.]|nr:phage major capsid protein [Thermohalobaculum sp.]
MRFMTASAAGSPDAVRLLIRPEVWDDLDGTYVDTGTGVTEWARLTANVPGNRVAISPNALAAPTGTPLATNALLTTTAG